MDTHVNKILPSSSREMRNRAEKQRRDKFNSYISEMGSLVSVVASAPRKLDKTSTLRLCANFIRIHQNVDVRDNPIGGYNSGAVQACHQMLETLDAFLMVVSCSGKIIYVSDRVEKILGHSQADMMGLALSNFVHRSDQAMIQKKLGDFATQVAAGTATGGESCVFETRLAERQLSRGEATVYERVRFSGKFRGPKRRPEWGHSTGVADRGQNGTSEPMLVAVVQLLQPQSLLPALTIIESMKNEYLTKHLPDGRIIQTDHRISIIAGYFMEEVMGYSAYNYIWEEDVEFAGRCQKLMLSSGGDEGMVTYRLRTRTGKLIFLRSRGIIEYDAKKEIVSFVCVNEMINEEEGMREIEALKDLQARLSSMEIEAPNEVGKFLMEAPRSPTQPSSSNGCGMESCELSPIMPISPTLECLSPGTYINSPASVASNISSPVEIEIPFPWCPSPVPERCNSSAILLVDQATPSQTNGVWKPRNGIVLNGLDSLGRVSPPKLDQHDNLIAESFNTPVSVMGESPADSHFINEEFSLLNKCSSKTKTMTTAAGFFKNVQPILLSGVMKDWERSNERFPRKCSVIHDAKDSTALPQLTNDIIHSPVHYFKDELGMDTATTIT